MSPVQTVSDALAAAGVEMIEIHGLALDAASVRFAVRRTGALVEGVIESIAVPSIVGRRGFELLDASEKDGVAVYHARRLPDLSDEMLGVYAEACHALVLCGVWRPGAESAMVIGLMSEAVDDGRLVDANRHVMRLSRLAADAVALGELELTAEGRHLLLRPESYEAAELAAQTREAA